jgi:hypothetical protein
LRIAALLLADPSGSFSCSSCDSLRQEIRGCSRMGKPKLTEPFLELADPRMKRGPFGRPSPSPSIGIADCPRAYIDAWTGQMLEVWGHVRASRDYFGAPAGRWPCKVSAALSVLSEEVGRIEAAQRARAAQEQAHAYQPGPGLPLDQVGVPARRIRG